MTDDPSSLSYGLNGERLACQIRYYHDSETTTDCLQVSIQQLGARWALIRNGLAVVTLLAIVYCLFELLSLTFASATLLSLIVLWRVACSSHSGSIRVVPGVGVQVATSLSCGYTRHQFVPWKLVNNVIINEGFTMYRVVFYLAILLGHRESNDPIRIVPIFTDFNPRLELVRKIYYEIKQTFNSNF